MHEPIDRNQPCTCGSGRQYMECCMPGDRAATDIDAGISPMTDAALCNCIESGLGAVHQLSNGQLENVRVKAVTIDNLHLLTCSYYSRLRDIMDLKIEMKTIQSIMAPILDGQVVVQADIKRIATVAFDDDDNELGYAICSLEILGRNDEITWLQNSLFQFDSPETRSQTAQGKIAEIEKALRKLIAAELKATYGEDWWSNALSQNNRQKAESLYINKFGSLPDETSHLLDYVYLRDVKKMIINQWNVFDRYFPALTQNQFSAMIDDLNDVRNDLAHQRLISPQTAREVERTYQTLLCTIAESFPELVPTYLLDNWSEQTQQLATLPFFRLWQEYEPTRDVESNIKLFVDSIALIKEVLVQLERIIPPLSRVNVHRKFLQTLRELEQTEVSILVMFRANDMEEVIRFLHKHNNLMAAVREITRDLLMLKHGL